MSEPVHLAQTGTGYDTVAEHYAALLPGLDAEAPLDVAMIDDFAARCLSRRAGPVADVGCGTGRVSSYLADRGLDVSGFDLSPGMVAVARRDHPRLRFEVAAMQALPVEDAGLDGVVAWYSFVHTPTDELDAVADELARVLAPDGLVLAGFHAGGGERVDMPSRYGPDPVPFTCYRHDAEQLGALLRRSGFELRARLLRAAEGRESAPQAFLLAARSH